MRRALLASAGAYGLAALVAGALARCWPGAPVDAVTAAMLAAPPVATTVAVASFAVRRTRTALIAVALVAALAGAALA